MWPGVTGVESPLGVPEIIDLALRLHPDTEAVAVITNVVGVDKDWLLAERAALLRYRDKVREIDLIGPPSPELLQKVAALPPHTVVLFQLFPQDSDQLAFGAFDVLASVAQRLPTYSILPLLDRGAVGAATYDATNDAVLAGQLAARVLSGERADDIPLCRTPMFSCPSIGDSFADGTFRNRHSRRALVSCPVNPLSGSAIGNTSSRQAP